MSISERIPQNEREFLPCSMFGSVELESLNPCNVNYVNIKVVTNPEGPFVWD